MKRRKGRAVEVLAIGVLGVLGVAVPVAVGGAAAPEHNVHLLAKTTLPADTYVALGDSYSSGEGLEKTAPTYLPPSNSDGCHRSKKAYPSSVAKSLKLSSSTFDAYPGPFVACSGAVTGSSFDPSSFSAGKGSLLWGRDNENPQPEALSSANTKYVTLTIGGNDLGLVPLLTDCLDLTAKLGSATYTYSSFVPSTSGCTSDINEASSLLAYSVPGISPVQAALRDVYNQILSAAPNATLYVLNYPQLFTQSAISGYCPVTGGVGFSKAKVYASYSPAHVQTFNSLEAQLDSQIAATVSSLQASGSKIQLVDINAGTQSQALPCSATSLKSAGINGLALAPGATLSAILAQCNFSITSAFTCPIGVYNAITQDVASMGSFHPKKAVHAYMATQVEAAMAGSGGGGGGGGSPIAAGYDHTCALISGGTVDCWGYNGYGELGNTAGNSSVPVAVVGPGGVGTLTGVTAVAVRSDHACALISGGTVDCWGNDDYGQLGNGGNVNPYADSRVPVAVVGPGGVGTLTGVTAVAAGDAHTCAVISGGTVDCWGNNNYGELGNGVAGTYTDSSVPVPVVGPGGVGTLTGVTAIASGDTHTCAVISGGTVDCWGNNNYGELGNGGNVNSTTYSVTPVTVVGPSGVGTLTGVTAVATGNEDTCALISGGTVDCWGYNGYGELGIGTSNDSHVPMAVGGPGGTGILSGVAAVAVGDYHTCALISGGTVDCWGNGYFSDLGNGTAANSTLPVAVVGL